MLRERAVNRPHFCADGNWEGLGSGWRPALANWRVMRPIRMPPLSADRQPLGVIHVLLHAVGLDHLWQEAPTAEAIALLAQGGGYLSSGQTVMLKIAFDLWNGEGNADLPSILTCLDPQRLALIVRPRRGPSRRLPLRGGIIG